MIRCGKCGPCRRWVVSLDRSERCEVTVAPARGVRFDPEGEHAARVERLRVVLARQGARRAA